MSERIQRRNWEIERRGGGGGGGGRQRVRLAASRVRTEEVQDKTITLPDGVIDGDVEPTLVELVGTDVDASKTNRASTTIRSLVFAEGNILCVNNNKNNNNNKK